MKQSLDERHEPKMNLMMEKRSAKPGRNTRGGRHWIVEDSAPRRGAGLGGEPAQVILAAGDKSLYEEAAPLFDVMGKKRLHLGEVLFSFSFFDVGTTHVIKNYQDHES